ncbi:MAG: diacylglycerol kinase family protein [bacterium]|nr:diacylglycerol kinase family protein [bacterium]
MLKRDTSLTESFRGAWDGLAAAYRKEPNLRFHVAAAWLALGMAWLAPLSILEWVCLIILIGVVVFAELVNTAMERLGDQGARGEPSLLVGEAKQVAAGAVLVTALAAVAAGLLLFAPKLSSVVERLEFLAATNPVAVGGYLLVLGVLGWGALVGRRSRGER